jgi:hypothetical protein
VITLLELGADPLILDNLHGGNALGWARVGGHEELADIFHDTVMTDSSTTL